MNRRSRFLFGLILVTLFFSIPIIILASVNAFQWLAILLACNSLGVYKIYRMTMKNIKPKYPIVNPEGCPDIYSGRMPRPIYEDARIYPWFFNKKRKKEKKKEKIRKNTAASNSKTRSPRIQILPRIRLTCRQLRFNSSARVSDGKIGVWKVSLVAKHFGNTPSSFATGFKRAR